MHLLYLDDSGSVDDPANPLFVLAGVSLFERQTHWLARQLDEVAARFGSVGGRDVELHGSPMHAGRGLWRHYDKQIRHEAMIDCLKAIVSNPSVFLYGAVVDLAACEEDAVCLAFEHLCSKFDRMLSKFHKRGNAQRGLILLDKHRREERIQTLARDFKELGHRWGVLRNMADVPVFLDSKASRMV